MTDAVKTEKHLLAYAILAGVVVAAAFAFAVAGNDVLSGNLFSGMRLGVWGIGLFMVRIAAPKLIKTVILWQQQKGKWLRIKVAETPINPVTEISLALTALLYGMAGVLAFSEVILGSMFINFSGVNDFTTATLSLLCLLCAQMFFIYHLSGPHFRRFSTWTFLWLCFTLCVSVVSAAPVTIR